MRHARLTLTAVAFATAAAVTPNAVADDLVSGGGTCAIEGERAGNGYAATIEGGPFTSVDPPSIVTYRCWVQSGSATFNQGPVIAQATTQTAGPVGAVPPTGVTIPPFDGPAFLCTEVSMITQGGQRRFRHDTMPDVPGEQCAEIQVHVVGGRTFIIKLRDICIVDWTKQPPQKYCIPFMFTGQER